MDNVHKPLAEMAQLLGVEPMKKAANCMSLAAFTMRYGGAGGN
jgi:hypothetical protein